jgi:succinyl-CoA synthetase alpha subunit
MSTAHLVIADRYRDSVTLLALAARLRAEPGIDDASVVMATPANLELVTAAGFVVPPAARPSDLLVSVRGEPDACTAALERITDLLDERPAARPDAPVDAAPRSVRSALAGQQPPSLVLVSVPGPFAAAEAAKALSGGAHVMIFSDNVSVADEVALKCYAGERGLLVMGPDCGTAVVDGVPLGFANVVRRGSVAVIGASGTGTQEVIAAVHRLGGGVSYALGTGGRDLSDAVGGLAMLQSIDAVAADPAVEVLVLVSKPPAERVLSEVTARVAKHRADGRLRIPVVTAFLGAPPEPLRAAGLEPAATLAGAASLAVAHLTARSEPDPLDASLAVPAATTPAASPTVPDAGEATGAAEAHRITAADRQYLRAAFCGGTFAYEAQLLWQAHGIVAASNCPVVGNPHIGATRSLAWPAAHSAIDFGADELTVGRPHPMIDPAVRDEAVVQAWSDPTSAVVVFDVVLGHGGAPDPVASLLERLDSLGPGVTAAVQTIAHVCGTDADPQDRRRIIGDLRAHGITVAASNADAAACAAVALGRGGRGAHR